jgi:hypothetical protein
VQRGPDRADQIGIMAYHAVFSQREICRMVPTVAGQHVVPAVTATGRAVSNNDHARGLWDELMAAPTLYPASLMLQCPWTVVMSIHKAVSMARSAVHLAQFIVPGIVHPHFLRRIVQ